MASPPEHSFDLNKLSKENSITNKRSPQLFKKSLSDSNLIFNDDCKHEGQQEQSILDFAQNLNLVGTRPDVPDQKRVRSQQ